VKLVVNAYLSILIEGVAETMELAASDTASCAATSTRAGQPRPARRSSSTGTSDRPAGALGAGCRPRSEVMAAAVSWRR
jgi:hypothetical protein